MKRLTLTLLTLCLLAGQAWGATYYVDPSGSDAAAGTATGAPWRTLERANLNVAAGDTVVVQNTTHSTRARSRMVTIASDNLTISGGHISDDVLLKDGVWDYRASVNDWLETWTTDSNAANWAESGTVSKEASVVSNGLYSAKIATSSYIRATYSSTAGALIRWRIIYRNGTGASLRLTVRNTSSTNYLQSDGTWAASPAYYTLPASDGVWSEHITTAATSETTGARYRLDLTSSGGDSYVDGCLVQYSSSWTLYSDDIYQYNSHLISAITKPVLKGTDSTAQGDYTVLTAAASLAQIAAGQYFHDTATGIVYYRLASGESISGLNIVTPRNERAIDINANGVVINGLNAYFSHGGINILGGTATLTNCSSYNVYATGIQTTGSSVASCTRCVSNGNKSIDAIHGGGFVSLGSSSFTLSQCSAMDSDDDAYQSAGTSTMILSSCLGVTKANGSVLEVSPYSGGRIEVYNSTFYRDSPVNEAVIRDKGVSDTVSIYRNTITVQANAGNNVVIDTVDRSGGGGSITTSNNMYSGSSVNAAYTATNADPLFVSSTDFHLQPTSPALWKRAALGSPYDTDFDGLYFGHRGAPIGAYSQGNPRSRNTAGIK